MLLPLLALIAAPVPTPAPTPAAIVAREDHGKLPWFRGSFDELLAAAKQQNKPVFIDFWADWCGWCKKLTKDTFNDDTVVAEMADFLVANIDTESKDGKPVAERFKVGPLPTLMFLNPDGSVRDVILGYRKPDDFKLDVQRIRRDVGTVGDLRRKVDAEPKSVAARIALGTKLKEIGDLAGLAAQAAEVAKLDPQRENAKTAPFLFDALIAQVETLWQQEKLAEIPPLMRGFLGKETDAGVLFKGWATLANIHEQLGSDTAQTPEAPARERHLADAWAAKREAWKHVPPAMLIPFGSEIARTVWDRRAQMSAAEKTFALEVARKIQLPAEQKRDVDTLELVACVFHMNGLKADALAVIARCLEFDPKNLDLEARFKEFGGG